MPAERTRSPKKEKEDIDGQQHLSILPPSPSSLTKSHIPYIGIQLTWTDPVESLAAPQQIAFAPAVTPGTYTDDLHVESAESIPSLFPSNPYSSTGPKKPGHGKKKAEDHIPRPPNAFILFRSSFIKSRHVSTEVETNHSTLSKIIGLTWQNMPHEERQFWHSKAKIAQAEHKRKHPDYAFRPSHVKVKVKAKGGGGSAGGTGGEQQQQYHQQQPPHQKRKVREVGPKDMKRCAKIAQLLVEGKKGADLKAAVEEFDKNHVPTVVTRFDTPITARSFRRSLSEPAPDTDPSAPAFLRPDPKKPSSRRLRATSSQPTMSRPSTPRMDEPAMMMLLGSGSVGSVSASSSFSSSSSVFCSSPFSNFSESADVPLDAATWGDMPPLVYPPVGSFDNSFVTKDASPSLVSVAISGSPSSFCSLTLLCLLMQDFNTFVFHDAPATCIESTIDPLTPAPNNNNNNNNNNAELYGAFHVETPAPCAAPAGSLEPQLAIDLSFLDSWSSASPFPSSPCTPISCYSSGGGPFSPAEVVPAPPSPAAYDAYNNMVAAQFDSRTGIVGFVDCSNHLGTMALSPEGLASAPLVVAHPHDQQHSSYLAASKGYFPSNGHKLPIPEMASTDVAGFTDVFMQSCQAFNF